MNKAERDDLSKRIRDADALLSDWAAPARERTLRIERHGALLGELGDRLPRAVLSIDPFTEKPVKRVFDPFGLDSAFWPPKPLLPLDHPDPGPHFQVLLGAVDFAGRAPVEVDGTVRPGPGAPFVVPDMLNEPGMVAVVGRLVFPSGDVAYAIAYFSDAPVDPAGLHQEWGRDEFWFIDPESGEPAWLASNAEWDFELGPWVERDKLLWIEGNLAEEGARLVLRRRADGPCPFVGLGGVRQPQIVQGGGVDLEPLPNGVPFEPFAE